MKKTILSFLLIFVFCLLNSTTSNAECTTHNWSEWKISYEPTCGREGSKYRYCLSCDEYQDEEIPATGNHKWDIWYIEENLSLLRNSRPNSAKVNGYFLIFNIFAGSGEMHSPSDFLVKYIIAKSINMSTQICATSHLKGGVSYVLYISSKIKSRHRRRT